MGSFNVLVPEPYDYVLQVTGARYNLAGSSGTDPTEALRYAISIISRIIGCLAQVSNQETEDVLALGSSIDL